MKGDNNIIYTARDIEQYLSGNLSSLQMHAMEKTALDDPFLAEAMEGFETMKGSNWNDQLAALRKEMAEKGSVAKIIPLHKTKNNWWKMAAAVFIIGSGTFLTFILTNNKTEEKDEQQIAQTTIVNQDSIQQPVPESPSVTASLNPTATETREGIISPAGPIATLGTVTQLDDKTISGVLTTAVNPSVPATANAKPDNTKIIVPAQPITNDANNNAQLSEDIANNKPAAKTNNEAEALNRQRNQGLATFKKEAVLNNFFTAQVVAPDNSPLPFTNISIKKENFGTYADAKGMVRLVSTDSILNVEVRSVGYLPKTFSLRNNQAQTKIVLQEDEVALKDKMVIGKADGNISGKSRRATLLKDSVVNVEPADGWENYNTYVANNLDIPEDMLRREIRGEVELSFDVKRNGTITNLRVNKSLGAEYDEAARRLIMEGPQWKVKKGKKTTANVKVQF